MLSLAFPCVWRPYLSVDDFNPLIFCIDSIAKAVFYCNHILKIELSALCIADNHLLLEEPKLISREPTNASKVLFRLH